MTGQIKVDDAKIANARIIGGEVLAAVHAAKAASATSPSSASAVDQLMAHAPASLKARLAGVDLSPFADSSKGMLQGSFSQDLCATGLCIGLAAAIGAGIILTGGMSIPAVLAAAAYSMEGLIAVISAMTGLASATVATLLAAAGATLWLVAEGLCEAMGVH